MPNWGYSFQNYDPERMAKASGRDLRISTKEAVEICNAIRYMKLDEAIKYLKRVIEKKDVIPYRRYRKLLPHRAGIGERFGVPTGRYPIKACKAILKVLENAKANAENKGLNVENLRICHAAAHKGLRLRSYFPRAFGRVDIIRHPSTHVEIVVEEVSK